MYIGGAAGFIIQALIGLAVAIPILIGVYGHKIREWFRRSKRTTRAASETRRED